MRRAGAVARAGGVVEQQAGRLRGLRRPRRKGGKGRESGEVFRLAFHMRGRAQARRRLHLFRFHAEPALRYRGPEPDDGRAEADRRAIYRLSRPGTALYHRGRIRGEAAAGAAGLAQERNRKGAGAAGKSREATGRRQRFAGARKSHAVRQRFVLLRMAAAFRRHQRYQKTVRRVAGQGEAELNFFVVPANAGTTRREIIRRVNPHSRRPGLRAGTHTPCLVVSVPVSETFLQQSPPRSMGPRVRGDDVLRDRAFAGTTRGELDRTPPLQSVITIAQNFR